MYVRMYVRMFKPLPQVYSRELPAFPEKSQELPLTKNSGFFPIGLKDLGELIRCINTEDPLQRYLCIST
jgi:hypothetical protein